MNPDALATRLNVLQVQMNRAHCMLWRNTESLRGDIFAWQAELRRIELELRGFYASEDGPHDAS